MNVLVVIPARGGSKGLPRKNVLPIGGRPLVALAVATALSAQTASRVVVSTDDNEIASAAIEAGAEVVRRPAEISGDAATSESALFHVLDRLSAEEGYTPDIVVLMQCTSPFTSSEEVDGVIGLVASGGADSAFAAAPFHHFLWRLGSGGEGVGVNHPGGQRKRRQDIEPQYLEAGSVYAMRIAPFRREGHRFCGRVVPWIGDAANVFEIDTPAEMERARAIFPLVNKGRSVGLLPKFLSAIVYDFDGVFTDNRVLTTQHGDEAVMCSRGDGMGIENLRQRGVPMLVLSKEQNPVVAARSQKMKLDFLQGVDDKISALRDWLSANGLDEEGLVYVGNDVNDMECLQFAACAVGPADSHPSVTPHLDIQLSRPGGDGAVRELCDMVDAALSQGLISVAGRAVGDHAKDVASNDYRVGDSDTRPWGRWVVLAAGRNWCVKRIEVEPGQVLSLQLHNFRDEVWSVAEGVADVSVDGASRQVNAGETLTIARGVSHRLGNSGDRTLVVIELQTGPKLDENDIVRLEDVYGRVPT